jgi:hypothetical protein
MNRDDAPASYITRTRTRARFVFSHRISSPVAADHARMTAPGLPNQLDTLRLYSRTRTRTRKSFQSLGPISRSLSSAAPGCMNRPDAPCPLRTHTHHFNPPSSRRVVSLAGSLVAWNGPDAAPHSRTHAHARTRTRKSSNSSRLFHGCGVISLAWLRNSGPDQPFACLKAYRT